MSPAIDSEPRGCENVSGLICMKKKLAIRQIISALPLLAGLLAAGCSSFHKEWSAAANWVAPGVPGSNDYVVIANGATGLPTTVTIGMSAFRSA